MLKLRPVVHVSRALRLPVWPVWSGVLCWATGAVGLTGLSDVLEARWGGRVRPMQLPVAGCDPFLMLVHHRHTFAACDPIRPLSALVMPEGFPAHPHRGFQTVTFVLEGGMRHRDSAGVKMTYRGGSVQWLSAGRGVLHEEMWAHEAGPRQELYQIWVNTPHAHKLDPPRVQLLGDATVERGEGVTQAPLPVTEVDGVRLTVISGACRGLRSPVETASPVTLLRLQWSAPATFTWDELPPDHTAMCFVRSGVVAVSGQRVGSGELAHLGPGGARVTWEAGPGADVLVLTGAPLREPVALGGAMVMSSQAEVDEAWRDFRAGRFGQPWPHRADDAAWLAALERSG
jgi:redox-sensitive bicupin YhaK (pirin superfamily)